MTIGRRFMAGFAEYKDRVLMALVGLLCTGGVAWCGWITLKASEIIPAAEIRQIIRTDSPYVEDRKTISIQLEEMKKSDDKLGLVIDRNTEAINALRVEIARGNKN